MRRYIDSIDPHFPMNARALIGHRDRRIRRVTVRALAAFALLTGLALGGSMLAGCGGSNAGTIAHQVARTTCGVVARAHQVCTAAGLSEDDSCPMPIPTAGGER